MKPLWDGCDDSYDSLPDWYGPADEFRMEFMRARVSSEDALQIVEDASDDSPPDDDSDE